MSILVSACLLIGGGFVLVAAIGLVRLPDLLMRMHAATKAGTLGAGLLLAAVAFSIPGDGVAVKAVATIVFLLLTAPIASHVIARSAYYAGDIKLWDKTHLDDLAEAIGSGEQDAAHRAAMNQGNPPRSSVRASRVDPPGNNDAIPADA
mgnify:FL=1